MATGINVPANVQLQNGTQLTQQIQSSVNRVQFNLGGAKGLRSLSQPLGRLTGQADEFTKSLDAANARVLAFGASVGVVNAVSNAFKALVNSTIEVEKAITEISVVGDQFAGKSKELGQGLFNIAKNTGQAFSEVSKAALEFSRQGLSLEQTLARTQDALVLTRTTGLDAAKSVDGLTAAVNAFSKAGLSTTQILNKLAAVDQAFAVSSADLIEAFQRTGAVAQQAGVSFDELAGIVTALQTETSRGGAVIGNALKTIFSRLQDTTVLSQLRDLGVAVVDTKNNILPARQILQNLAGDIEGLGKVTQAGVFKDVAGTFQLNQLVSLLGDLNRQQSVSAKATQTSAGATNEAYIANEKLNQSLDAILNKVATTGKQVGSLLGEIGLSDNLKGLLDGVNYFLEEVTSVLQGDDLGSKFAKGIVKGIGAVLSGPGLGIFLAIIAKLSFDLAKFGTQSLKTFFNIGKAASDQKQIQESIVQILLRNSSVLKDIENTQGGINAQAAKFVTILNQELQAIQKVQGLAGGVTGAVYSAGYRTTEKGLQKTRGKAAGGYLPAQEAADVRRGVGGASPNSKVVAIPNFAFGGGKRGTMIANTSEYIVPNYAGGGSAIFNQDMVKTMGLPAGAKKIGAAGGFVPNFANINKVGENINFSNYSVSEILSKGGSLQQINKVDSVDEFSGIIDIIRQKRSNFEYNKASQKLLNQFWPKKGDNTNTASLRFQKFNNIIQSLQKKGVDSQSLNRIKTNYSSNNYRDTLFQIKGVLGELDASKKSGQGLSANNAYLDLIGGGEVKTRVVTPLSNLIKKSANNFLNFSIENYQNKKRDKIGLPKLPVYLPADGALALNASGGYIPNFANYVYDADRIPSAQRQQILQSILGSAKIKNLLVGPAGSGKSTAVAGMGTFIKSLDDLRMASSFTILSSSGLSSKGGLTEPFQNILSAVNRSGGKTTYLGATNEELKQRRASRTLSGDDFRSAAELSGSAYAPLNQSSFIKQLKKESGSFEMMRSKKSSSATGFTNDQLAILGLNGQNGNINGSPVFTLSAQRPNLTRDIQREYEVRVKSFVRSYSQELANKIGIKRSPKEVKKAVQQSASVSGFIFEDVLNQLSGGFNTASLSGGSRIDFRMTPNLKTLFKTGDQKYAEAKLNPYSGESFDSIVKKQAALASGRAFLPQENIDSSIKTRWSAYKARASKKSGFEEFNSIARALNIDPTRGSKADVARKIENTLANASTGYIPNFAASALQQAIAREKSAGLSDSQIYIDQNPSLKSPQNPMGLMVANTRDEPFGGIQGISRARKEGANPKLYGAANGFVPNYAAREALKSQGYTISLQNADAFDKKLQELADEVSKQTKSFKAASKELETFVSTLKTVGTKQKPSAPYDAPTQQALLTLGKEKLEASKPAKEPKSIGDSLAKVVGIQTAFIGLQSVVESMADEGSDFSKNFKAFGGIISGVTSGLTLFTAGLGPIGIALGAVTVGFNLLRDVFPDALQSIKESFGGLSLEGQKASKALDEFAEKVARGGVSVEEALKSAEQQASEAILRTKAKEKGIKTETDAGELKDPAKLARELVIQTARRNQANLGLGTDIYKKVGTQTQVIGSEMSKFGKMTVEKDVFNQAPALFSDLNESTQNVIFDIFEETVSVNKAGLVALGNKIKKEIPGFQAKDFQDLVDEAAVQKYRSELLTAIIRVPQARKQISDIIQKATTGQGENRKIDEKVVVEELKKSGLFNLVKDYLKEISPAAAAIEGASPVNVFRANIDDLIRTYSDFSSTLNRAINNRISLLEGLTSSQTFAGLSEQQQFQTKAALDRFKSNTSFQSQKRALTEEVQSTLGATLKDFRAIEGIDVSKINALANELSTLDVGNLESFLNKFGSTVKLSGDKLIQFNNDVSKFNNKSKDLFANREVEVQLLNFSIQERQNELNSIKAFYGGMDKFTEGIRKQEARLREIDFNLRTNQQTAEFRKQMLDIQAPNLSTLRQSTLDIETQAFQKEQDLKLEQAGIQAKIELDRKLYTLENITALNRNTDVLYEILKSNQEQSLVEDIKKINEDIVSKGAATPEQAANLIASKNALQSLRSTTSNLSSVAIADKFKNLVEAPTDDARKLILESVPNEAQRNNLKQTYEEYSNSLKISSENYSREPEFFKEAQKQLKEKQAAEDSYTQALNQAAISLERSILSNPMSRGQFAAAQRNLSMAQEEQKIFGEKGPAGVQEYRSSFRRGLEEGLIPIEERVLDFRNQLGKEIPDLFSQNLAQGLNDAISGAKDLKTALTDAATSFFQEITRKNISNLADLVTGGFGTFGNVLGKASGGFISGGSGNKDDVPAMLMGGEYVVKKSAVSKYGKGFLDSLNNGSMRGYATGGLVDPQTFPTQTGRGGFFTPGDYGQGAITGKNELLAFATQTNTGGRYDYMGGFGMNGATVSLEPESARLSATGRENSPMFERIQQSKDEAFRVYLEGLQKEKEYADLLDQIAKDKKARKKQLQTAIISAVISSAASYAGNTFATGAKNASASSLAAGGKGGFLTSVKGGFSNLGNLFSPSKALGLNSDAQFLKSIGVNSYKDLRKLPIENSLKFAQQYPNIGTTYTNFFGTRRAAGGLISGGSNIRDDVPAMLTGGEFVLNNRATQRIGLQNLTKLNNGQTTDSGASSADMTQALISKLDELIQATQNSSSDNVVVNVSTNEAGTQNQESSVGAEKELGKKIKQAVLDVIAQEKRLGGSLEKAR